MDKNEILAKMLLLENKKTIILENAYNQASLILIELSQLNKEYLEMGDDDVLGH